MTTQREVLHQALLALIDDYAEARHAGGCHTYNVKTNEARKQVAAELRRRHPRHRQGCGRVWQSMKGKTT
jgi:hypothetical protein